MISFTVTAKLICIFVFAYAKSQFSHDAAQMTNNADADVSGSSMVVGANLSEILGKMWNLKRIKHFEIETGFHTGRILLLVFIVRTVV